MNIPLSGCNAKFSAKLSTIIVFDRSLPNLLKSFTNPGPLYVACCLYNRCLMHLVVSILSRTQSAYYMVINKED